MIHESGRPAEEARCYTGAVDHYLSAARHDGVKTHWEQPFTRGVFRRAIDGVDRGRPLRVLDVGSGTGDGLALLAAARPDGRFEYTGLDLSPDMVATARRLHAHLPDVRFVEGDVREAVPDQPFDLYLSCGVPYSHLTRPELRRTLGNILSTVRRNRVRAAVVVDVLGRYSIEWPSKWPLERWPYRMSFFSTDGEIPPTDMSVYSAGDLARVLRQAAGDAACALAGIEFFDRSIMVGRHTTTGEYNPAIPRYRTLVNSLMDPARETPFPRLLFDARTGEAPAEVLTFFGRFAAAWNALILQAAGFCGETPDAPESVPVRHGRDLARELEGLRARGNGGDFRPSVVEPTLAEHLRRLEASAQPGLGVGHSLTAIAYVGDDLPR